MKGKPQFVAAAQKSMVSFTDEETEYARLVTRVVSQIVPGLARALAPRTEVLLHDLTKFPNSIVAIENTITGRSLGGPPTDLGMKTLNCEPPDDLIGYRTELPSGQVLKSSSLFFRAPITGRTVAALCINADIDHIMRAQEVLATLGFPLHQQGTGEPEDAPRETFPESVDVLAQSILRDAIAASGVSIDLMKKSHKMNVVRELDERGFFTLRESIDLAAKGLRVSRHSIYNYLREFQESKSGS